MDTGERQEHGMGQALVARTGETAVTAAAERVKAEVETPYKMALRQPRDINQARVELLASCKRPRFAEAAIYNKPIGDKMLRGPSIKLIQAGMQCMSNINATTCVVYEDESKIQIRTTVTDYEKNVSFSKEAIISKYVERRQLRKGQVAISSRTNSTGQITYTVAATEDEIQNKISAIESKMIRNNGGKLIPADIIDEAMDACRETIRGGGTDPSEQTKRIADAFAALGVTPASLAEYLGHPLAQITPAEREELLGMYAALKDGEATWAGYMAQKVAPEKQEKQRGILDLDSMKPGDPSTHTGPGDDQPAMKARATKKAEPKAAPVDDAPTETVRSFLDAYHARIKGEGANDKGLDFAKQRVIEKFGEPSEIPETDLPALMAYCDGDLHRELEMENYISFRLG